MPVISSMLWFDHEAEEAASFYVSIFPNSKINAIVRRPPNVPSPNVDVMVVDFELDGTPVSALNGGPLFKFSEAVSLVVHCQDQSEIDYYWEALLAGGGQESACGWLKDRYGFSWQITPEPLLRTLAAKDPARIERAMGAIMTMRKLDLAQIQAAIDA